MYAHCQMLKVIILIIRINLFIQKLSISRTSLVFTALLSISRCSRTYFFCLCKAAMYHTFSVFTVSLCCVWLTTSVLLYWCCVLLLLWSSLCVVVVVTHCYWHFILSLLNCLMLVKFNCLCQLVCGVQF